jgi:hypothetical protein
LNIIGCECFKPDEAERVYDLLNELGCIGNLNCGFHDFTPTTNCGYKTGPDFVMTCTDDGFLGYMYEIRRIVLKNIF